MQILLKTLQDALPMFILLGSTASFLVIARYVATAPGVKTVKKLSWDMHHPTRFMRLD